LDVGHGVGNENSFGFDQRLLLNDLFDYQVQMANLLQDVIENNLLSIQRSGIPEPFIDRVGFK